MTLPDWLVERAALGEVPPHARQRLDRADPHELAERIAALRTDNAAELAAYPAGPAVDQIEAGIAAERRRRANGRRRRWTLLGLATSAAAALVVAGVVIDRGPHGSRGGSDPAEPEITRVKGLPRLLAFRQLGGRVERLVPDALVREGDVIQLRYHGGGHHYGVIASVDGAGVVTLHHPARDDAPPEATALSPENTSLPHAYELDDAPRFERFFFITADEPIDVQRSLESLRELGHRADSATAPLELPAGMHQWSFRLRKPDSDRKPSTP